VHLDPELTHGSLRRPVEVCDQAVQALVPARTVARGLAELNRTNGTSIRLQIRRMAAGP
jgi:hypothetical protein